MEIEMDSSDEEHVQEAIEQISLPKKSLPKYMKEYEAFNKWRFLKNYESCSEKVFIAYFIELAKVRVPSSLWAIYSMLKAVVKMKHDVDMGRYTKLLAYLKRINVGYVPKSTKLFTAAEVDKFLKEAPDIKFLPVKVALIIGISGACSIKELQNLNINDIEKHSDILFVKLSKTNTNNERKFFIRDEYVKIVEKYMLLRPEYVNTNRFLLLYRNGKCISQVMGRNTLAMFSQQIATYLKLKDPKLYTRRSLRKIAGSGAYLNILNHVEWKNNNVAESIEDSNENKSKFSEDTVSSRKRKLSDSTSPTSKDTSPSPDLDKKGSSLAGVCNSNAILSGLIDYYCLVCEDLFGSIEDVHHHVDTPHHNNLLQQTFYVGEYTEHRIRKLRKGYFCEYCNEAFTTSSKMRSHVDSETHVYRRNSKQFSSSRSVLNLSWSGNRVLTSQLLIDERPWNGILDDDTCLVCDEEIDSFEDHKKILSHVLKLAQTKILFGKDELSRKINDSLYQCLICNTMCPANDYDKHNTTGSHIMNYTKVIRTTPVSTVDNSDVDQTSSNTNDCEMEEDIMFETDIKVEQNSEEINDYFETTLDGWG